MPPPTGFGFRTKKVNESSYDTCFGQKSGGKDISSAGC